MPSVISQTAEYALRAVAALAQEPDHPLTAQQIAARTQVPLDYLRKVMRLLTRAGLVRGQRGARGGFSLARSTSQVSVLDVVNAIDPVERIRSCPLAIGSHGTNLCALHRRLDDAIARVEQAFAQTTIAEILDDQNPATPLCESTESTEPT